MRCANYRATQEKAYVGVPISSPASGQVVGHIIALDPQPVTSGKGQTAILKIFAARAGAELDRMKAVKELDQKNSELRQQLKDIELYHTTINNIRHQIFWLDKEGAFMEVNEQVSLSSGYSMDELKTISVFHINPSLTKEEWQRRWKETQVCGKQVLETVHRKKDGKFYAVEITNTFFAHEGIEYFCSMARDVHITKTCRLKPGQRFTSTIFLYGPLPILIQPKFGWK